LAHTAAKTGVRVSTISLLEKGKANPSLETAATLVRAYGVSREEAGAVLVREAP
jgi:transcriptional regulator with XRE-family HTH domain